MSDALFFVALATLWIGSLVIASAAAMGAAVVVLYGFVGLVNVLWVTQVPLLVLLACVLAGGALSVYLIHTVLT